MSQPSPLAAAQQRALAQRNAGDPAGAREYLDDILSTARRSYGEDHPEVLAASHFLARLHRESDDPAAARRILEIALEAAARRMAGDDPLVLSITADLAGVAEELGNRHEARKHHTRIATDGPAVLGAAHWAVQAARAFLGDAAPAPAGQSPAGAGTAAAHAAPQSAPPAPPYSAPRSAPPATPYPSPQSAPPAAPRSGPPDSPQSGAPDSTGAAGRPVNPALDALAEPTTHLTTIQIDEPTTRPGAAEPGDEATTVLSATPPPQGGRSQAQAGRPVDQAASQGPDEPTMIVAPTANAETGAEATTLMPLATPPPRYSAPAQPQGQPPPPYAAPTPPRAAPTQSQGWSPQAQSWAPTSAPPVSSPPISSPPISGPPISSPPGAYTYPPGPHPPHFAPPPRPAPQQGWHDPGPERPRFGEQASRPFADDSTADRPKSRGLIVTVSILAVVALAAVVAAVVLVIGKLGDGPADPGPAPSAAPLGPAPQNVQLRDDGTSVRVSWEDPSGGLVSFLIAGGRPNQLGLMANVPAGQTSQTLEGLSPSQDYCFAVMAVYGVDNYSTSEQVCTKRAVQPTPS